MDNMSKIAAADAALDTQATAHFFWSLVVSATTLEKNSPKKVNLSKDQEEFVNFVTALQVSVVHHDALEAFREERPEEYAAWKAAGLLG